MSKLSILFPLSLLFVICVNAQSEYPINPATGLISINNVLQLEGRSVKNLKETAEQFINSYSDNNTSALKNRNTEQKVPTFSAKKTLDGDSILVFDCAYTSATAQTITWEQITYKIQFYFKPNKVKYDISNFTYLYSSSPLGIPDQISGKFENQKPDQKANKRVMNKWEEGKIKGIKNSLLIAKTLEEFFKKNQKSQFDF